jgi:O-antigen/teichoic acid export membrane protein
MNYKSGFIYLTITNVLFILVGYLTNIFLARRLGPSDYGVYGVITALMTAINILQVSGIPQSVSKYVAEKKDQNEPILASGLQLQLFLTLSVAVILFLCAPFVAKLFNDDNFLYYARLMSLVFPFYGIFALYTGYYNGLQNFKRQALMNFLYILFKLILVIGLAILFGLYGVIIGFVISPLLAIAGGIKIPNFSKLFSRKIIILYSIPLIALAGLSTLQLTLDIFSLKAMVHNSSITGYYAAAQSIAIIPYFGLSAIGVVLMPSISNIMGEGKLIEARTIISTSLKYLLMILIPIALLMATTAPQLVSLLFGQNYSPSVTPLRILLLAYVLLTIFAMMANILNGSGHAKKSMLIASAGVAVSLIGYIILIPKYSSSGAAVSTLLGSSIASILSIILVYSIFRFRFSIFDLLKIILASLFILIGINLKLSNVFLLGIYYLVSACIYIYILRIMGLLSHRDFNLITNKIGFVRVKQK